jgi:hypothetical protein
MDKLKGSEKVYAMPRSEALKRRNLQFPILRFRKEISF